MTTFFLYVGIGIAGLIVAITVNYLTAHFGLPKKWNVRRLLVAMLSGVLVIAVLSVLLYRFGNESASETSNSAAGGSDAAGRTSLTPGPTEDPVPTTTAAATATTTPSSTDDPGDGGDGSDDGPTLLPAPSSQYLSELDIVDYNPDANTGGSSQGTKDINGTQFGHSVSMNAGCQNGDGGEYWIDFTIGEGWGTLSGQIGLDGRSSAESTGTWSVLDPLTDRQLATGSLAAGPAVAFDADVSSTSRLRLFMDNPNAPNQACGFVDIRTVLVWGDAILKK